MYVSNEHAKYLQAIHNTIPKASDLLQTSAAPPVTQPPVLLSSGWRHRQGYTDEHQRSVGGRGERTEGSLPIHPRQNHRPPESR